MPRAEHNSKAEIRTLYKISDAMLRKWLRYLKKNAERLATERNDVDYLAFKDYDTNVQLLTPLQIKVIKKHNGEP